MCDGDEYDNVYTITFTHMSVLPGEFYVYFALCYVFVDITFFEKKKHFVRLWASTLPQKKKGGYFSLCVAGDLQGIVVEEWLNSLWCEAICWIITAVIVVVVVVVVVVACILICLVYLGFLLVFFVLVGWCLPWMLLVLLFVEIFNSKTSL